MLRELGLNNHLLQLVIARISIFFRVFLIFKKLIQTFKNSAQNLHLIIRLKKYLQFTKLFTNSFVYSNLKLNLFCLKYLQLLIYISILLNVFVIYCFMFIIYLQTNFSSLIFKFKKVNYYQLQVHLD